MPKPSNETNLILAGDDLWRAITRYMNATQKERDKFKLGGALTSAMDAWQLTVAKTGRVRPNPTN